MNELQLVGYTADLKFLVFSDAADGAARFKVPVDEDLEATLTEVLQLIDPDRAPLVRAAEAPEPEGPASQPTVAFAAQPQAPAPPPRASASSGLFDDEEEEELFASHSPARKTGRNGKPSGPQVGLGALAGQAILVRRPEVENGDGKPRDVPEARESRLSPRQIQALLRAGLTPRQVAKQAGTDEEWVSRWLAPIEAERDLILQAVQRGRITKARLGESRDLLGEAVRRNLAEKGVSPDEEHVEWFALRKPGDPHWVVTLRYRSRGRNQRAVWHFDPDTEELAPRNALATDVAWTRTRRSGRAPRREGVVPAKKPGSKKAAAKKSAAKRAGAKRAGAKKTAARRPAAKRAASKKSAAPKRAAVKKAAPKRTAAPKKSTARGRSRGPVRRQ